LASLYFDFSIFGGEMERNGKWNSRWEWVEYTDAGHLPPTPAIFSDADHLPPSPAPAIFSDAVHLPPRRRHHLRHLPPSPAIAHSLYIALSLSLTLSPATVQICRSEVWSDLWPPSASISTGFGRANEKREKMKKREKRKAYLLLCK
jgi:hypothetical protein